MSEDTPIVISSDPTLGAEQILRRTFATARRGFDPTEVRAFMARIADEIDMLREREREVRRRLDEAERRPTAPPPPLDEATLMSALGEETARVLRSAHEAAADITARAEHKVARLVRETEVETARLREEAETILARRTEEAEAAVEGLRSVAAAEIEATRSNAVADAQALIEAAREEGRTMLSQAQTARERVLADLARRRKVGLTQIEQLRAGRDRLLEAYRLVRRTLEEVTDELTSAEAEARVAAEEAGRRAVTDDDIDVEAIAAAVAAVERPADAPASAALESEPAAAAPEPAGAEAAAPEPPAAPEPVDERRSSSLRIIRRAPEPVAPQPEPVTAEVPAADVSITEAFEVETLAVAEPEPPSAPPPETEEPEAPEAPEVPRREVESLFARMRAERDAAIAAAPALVEVADVTTVAVVEAGTDGASEPGSATSTNDDEAALQRRDALLEPVDTALERRLKRALQDDQNAVLDAIRVRRGELSVDTILPAVDEHRARYRDVAAPLLQQAAEAGALYLEGDVSTVDTSTAIEQLAGDVVDALHDRLGRRLDASSEGDDLVDRVNAVYREVRTQRITPAARYAVALAFSAAAYDAVDSGEFLRWVVDDEGDACPDCDDDALAGPIEKGTAFPTGQRHPPAHVGCRCLLVRAGA